VIARFLLPLAALALAACDRLDQKGMLLVLDPAYTAETLLSNGDGIVSPDGLRWENGNLYIADEGGSAVRVLTPSGLKTLATAKDGLRSPEDLARGSDGALYWTDDDAGGLWRLGSDGKATRRVPAQGPLASTEGLAAAPSAKILIGGTGRILMLAPDESLTPLPLPIAKPESMAFDAVGNLYIADNEADILYLLTRDGRLHRTLAGREGFSPETLHFAGGALLITDSRNGKLHRYTPEDGISTLAVFAGDLGNVQGVTSDPAGNIYLSLQTDLKAHKGLVVRLRKAPAK
jgi:DNA-binding beta-propeller fold protein YncE